MRDHHKLVRRTLPARTLAVATATAVVIAPVLLSSSAAFADTRTVDADSAAHAHWLSVAGLGLDVAGAAYTLSDNDENPGPITDPLNLSVLNGLASVDIGTISLPLIKPGAADPGLLQLGNLGVISSYSSSPDATNSTASTGLINSDGAINVDAVNNGGYGFATLDANALLGQIIGQPAVDALLDQASIQIGALGSRASKSGAELSSEYMLSDLILSVRSPAVGGLVGTIDDAVGAALNPLVQVVGPGGDVETLLQGIVTTIDRLPLVQASANAVSLDTSSVVETLKAELLREPLSNSDGSVTIDLASGAITVDLGALVVDRSGSDSLSSLPANTEVLHGDTVNAILDGVTDALTGNGPNSLISKTINLVTEGIYNVELDLSVDVAVRLGALLPPRGVRPSQNQRHTRRIHRSA